jgi:hypothetical protein
MRIYACCLAAALLGTAVAWGQVREAPPLAPAGANDGIEVLTRGPVHEAFAETISFDPEPGIVVPQPAPEAIEELPPEQKPEGANVDWIPGYWAWDDERSDFLWVSGIWRALPPGRQWMPGYWAPSGRGAQWISGYWADAQATEIEYLPEPPQTVEAGPNVEAPSANHTWLPGSWVWYENRYAWRPGVWALAQQNWVWNPAHYVWAPRGYVYVNGYYDHSVARRGVLFAPVYFTANTYSRRGFSYSPSLVINPAVFASHLFLRPSYGHYYFGDYYATSYASRGFSPWFSVYSSRSGYDPFYAHQRWEHRNDRQWDRRVEADFANRRDNEDARPPRTWSAHRERGPQRAGSDDRSYTVAASLDDLTKSKEAAIRFQPVAKEAREQYTQRGQEFRKTREERQQLEAAAAEASTETPTRTVKPVKVKVPRSPIASQPVDRLEKDYVPPQAIEAPGPDLKVEPKPRKPRGNATAPREPGEPRETTREPRPDRSKGATKGTKGEPRETRPEPRETKAPKGARPEPKPDSPKPGVKPDSPKPEAKPEPPKEKPAGESKGKGQSPGKGKNKPKN